MQIFIVRPKRNLIRLIRNNIYRVLCYGNLPPNHNKYPGIKLDAEDLDIYMTEIYKNNHKKIT